MGTCQQFFIKEILKLGTIIPNMVMKPYNFNKGGVQMATFAERLKELRKEKQLTVEQLAQNIGSAKSTISRYENGREPKGDIIRLLTEYFL